MKSFPLQVPSIFHVDAAKSRHVHVVRSRRSRMRLLEKELRLLIAGEFARHDGPSVVDERACRREYAPDASEIVFRRSHYIRSVKRECRGVHSTLMTTQHGDLSPA